jgi:UDP-N-acetyl-D-mannosaminuronic acid transferase (WecB/TagA/CpsF family)/ABC-type transporter Mla MlaB component
MNDDSQYPAPLAIFGIPITNLDLANLVTKCLEIIRDNKLSGKTSYFTWLEGDLISKCYGLFPSTINNPKLLSLLRNADICCESDNFLNKIGNFLGSATVPSISKNDFLNNLLRILGEHHKSIFFLSNNEKEIKNVALAFHDKFHKLRLVGVVAPSVFTEGEDLIFSNERDSLLVEQINASNTDLLIIDLGYPKQLLWLDRVAENLRVPLVLTFDENFLKRNIKSPSFQEKIKESFQKMKLASITIPLLFFHSLNRYVYQWFFAQKNHKKKLKSNLFLSVYRTIANIELPECIDTSSLSKLNQTFDEVKNHDTLIFNFQNVRHIQPEGFYSLIKAWLFRNELKKEIFAYAIPGDIIWLMKVNRCWDLFKNTVCNSPEDLMSRLNGPEQMAFHDAFYQHDNDVVISILGSLNKDVDFETYMQKIKPIIDLKNCDIDLNYCTYVDNAGFEFLLDLRKFIHDQKKQLTLLSVNKNLYRQFKAACLDKTFIFK